ALERLNKALEYDPAFGDAYVLKSYVLLEVLPNLDGALSAAKLATQYAPNNPDSQYTLGLVYEKRGQYADAERAMREALVVNPNYKDVYFSLGILYADEIQDPQKSVEAFTRYLELGWNHARARAAVAQALPAKPSQDAEKARQLRSRIVQILDVPERGRLRSSLAAALLDGLVERPAVKFSSGSLGPLSAFEIPQPDFYCFSRNFCPADLGVFGKDCGCLGILNLQAQNLNDTVINLNVCHGYPPLVEE